MSLKVNLRLLEKESIQLDGDILGSELAPDFHDELMRLSHPVEYELTVDRQSESLLVTGSLRTHVDCECSRCLKSFASGWRFCRLDPFGPRGHFALSANESVVWT